jgi:hypothetical protein
MAANRCQVKRVVTYSGISLRVPPWIRYSDDNEVKRLNMRFEVLLYEKGHSRRSLALGSDARNGICGRNGGYRLSAAPTLYGQNIGVLDLPP